MEGVDWSATTGRRLINLLVQKFLLGKHISPGSQEHGNTRELLHWCAVQVGRARAWYV
jgi:hypothetical protein